MNHHCPTCFQILPPGMDLTVVLEENTVIWKGIACQLTAAETEVMVALTQGRPGDWHPTDRIVAAVYGAGEIPITADKTVRVHIAHIRRKLRDEEIPITVESSFYRGGGGHAYRLKYGY